jgi:hypothetical protein
MPRPRLTLPRPTLRHLALLLAGLLLAGQPLSGPGALAEKDPSDKPAEEAAPPAETAPPPIQVTGLRVEIVERGLYQTSTGVIRQMPNGIGENLVDAIDLERSTTHIPARPGVSFGLEFVVHGRPPGTALELTTTVVFPPPGLHPPGMPGPVPSSTTPMVVEVGSPAPIYRGYTFDYEWEVAPGPWRFEIRAGDRLLAVQSFIITSESSFRK